MQWIGYIGLALVVACWIPQSVETVKLGRCPIHLWFLILNVVGSACLTIYAIWVNDVIFAILNGFITCGSTLNLYYKLFPRKTE
ncbi:MAG TPA: PQ-loop domain-containing transporter [Bacteroidota bacterium]